jgi:hypothetical protein
MIVAVALMLAAPDHWGVSLPGTHSHHDGGESSTSHVANHARHCHGDAATCTDLPLTSTGGIAALQGWLTLPLVFDAGVRIAGAATHRGDPATDVLTPPPRQTSI